MKYDGNNWVDVGIPGFSASNADWINLYIYEATPYVTYQDYAFSQKATVMKYDGANWVTVGSPGFSAGQAVYNTIFVYNGIPYVAFEDVANGGKATVMKFDGTNWTYVGAPGFSQGPAAYTAINVYNGTPYVAYEDDYYSSKITVKMFDGTNWVNVGNPGFSNGGAGGVNLVIDKDGTMYAGFADNSNGGKATVMKYQNGSWVNVGNAGFSAGTANFPSLFVYNGTPYMGYFDSGNSGKATVMKFDGSNWVDVGNAGFSAGTANYTSMFVDNGIIYIGYMDGGNSNRATVMKFDCVTATSNTATTTATFYPTSTFTGTTTFTLTAAITSTITLTCTATPTLTATPTATETSTATLTDSITSTATGTADATGTSSATLASTATATPEATLTPCIVTNGVFQENGFGSGTGMAIDAGGNIYITGSGNAGAVIWKYRPDGTIYSGFGTGGIAAAGISGAAGHDVAIDSSGNIIMAGITPTGMGVWKFDTGGNLLWSYLMTNGYEANGLAIDTAGNILVTGTTEKQVNSNMTLWRLTPAGILDGSFNGGSVVVDALTGGVGNGILLDGQGTSYNIYITGEKDNGANTGNMVLWEYNSNGVRVAGFGAGGYLIAGDPAGAAAGVAEDYGLKIAHDGMGNIVVGGYAMQNNGEPAAALWKYTGTGNAVTAFGINGSLISTPGAAGHGFIGYSMAVDGCGRIIVAGSEFTGTGQGQVGTFVCRFDINGDPDAAFNGGNNYMDFNSLLSTSGSGLAINGKNIYFSVSDSNNSWQIGAMDLLDNCSCQPLPTSTAPVFTATPTLSRTSTATPTVTSTAASTPLPTTTAYVEVYISDSINNRIEVFDGNGNYLRQWSSSFYSPMGIAIDNKLSRVYVVDNGNQQIQAFDLCGNFITAWGSLGKLNGQFNFPTDVAVDSSDNVYVADQGNQRVQIFDRNGNYLAQWDVSTTTMGISIDKNDNVYVTSADGAEVMRFNTAGTKITQWHIAHRAYGVANDAAGNVYVTSFDPGPGTDQEYIFDQNGNMITTWEGVGTGPGEFLNSFAVDVGSNNMVYIVDQDNNRIQEFDTAGNYLNMWGTLGAGNGQLNHPLGIAISNAIPACAAATQSFTPTPTATMTLTTTATFTYTMTPTATASPTFTFTATATITPTMTFTATNTWTRTATSTVTRTVTGTVTRTATATFTCTATRSFTATVTKTITPTVTATFTPTVTPTQTAGLSLQYYSNGEPTPGDNTIYIDIKVINNTATAVNLSSITVKYWYEKEGTADEIAECDWASAGCGNINRTISTISQSGQNRVLTLAFTSAAGAIPPGGNTEMKLRVHKTDWSVYDETNDYSYGAQLAYIDWTKMTMYSNGALIWGTEPGGMGAQSVSKYKNVPGLADSMSEENVYSYPNPSAGRVTIKFSAVEPEDVKILITDIAGNVVYRKMLNASEVSKGVNGVVWNGVNENGRNVANGVYLLIVQAEGRKVIKKIAIIK